MVEDTLKPRLPSLEGPGLEAASAAVTSAEVFKDVEEEALWVVAIAAFEEEAPVATSVLAAIVVLVLRTVTTRRQMPRPVPIGLVVVALVEGTVIAMDQGVGMTRGTAVAHMMIDQADIATEADSVIAIVGAAPTSSRFVADESIGISTGRERTRVENGATKAATKTRENCDDTKPTFLSRQE